MMTGDYSGTAQFVARSVGIKNAEEYLTGEDLDRLDYAELKERIRTINVFARVVPEQKLLIINALKANDEIVAMTGDGVNDSPALKSANIGIAMGQRGTDVAREASSLILLDDDFSSIVSAVRLGRRIYDNLKRAMGYILAVHVPIAGISVLPLFFNLPIVLLPAHIAFLELIIDPACSTVFESEKEDKNIMKRPPRNLKQPILDFKTVAINLTQGLGVLLVTFLLFVFAVKLGRNEAEARAIAFTSLVFANLLLIAINLSWSKNIHKILLSSNRPLFIVSAGALMCLFAVLYIPFFADLFHLAPLNFNDFILIGAAVCASLIWFEVLKLFRYNKQR
jgi:Ca2+-transporting ATPase